MKIEWERISPAFVITGAVITASSLFQVGYFFSYGMNFMSMVSVGDWIFFSGILAIPIAFIVTFAVLLMDVRNLRAKDALWGLGIMSAASLLILVLFGVPWMLIGCLAFVLAATYLWSVLFSESGDRRLVGPFSLVFVWSMLCFMSGTFYARESGHSCILTLADGNTIKASYKRSVVDGHLLMIGKERVFLSKDAVREIRCTKGETEISLPPTSKQTDGPKAEGEKSD